MLCDGKVVADNERAWARHQSISDPAYIAAAKMLRRALASQLGAVTVSAVPDRQSAEVGRTAEHCD